MITSKTTSLRIFVAGAGSGIGAALAEGAAARGHRIFAGGRRHGALHQSGNGMWTLPLDVRDEDSCAAAIAAMADKLGGVDALVVNAGVPSVGAVEETPLSEFERVMDVNFFGALRMIKATLPAMRAAGRGVIVVVSSLSGLIGLPGDGAYAASKFALEGACESLAGEVGRFGVRVVVVEPGGVSTEFMEQAPVAGAADASAYAAMREFFARRAARAAGGMAPSAVADEIMQAIESPTGALRRPIGDQARSVARTLRGLDGEDRARFALKAAGLDWWADGLAAPKDA